MVRSDKVTTDPFWMKLHAEEQGLLKGNRLTRKALLMLYPPCKNETSEGSES